MKIGFIGLGIMGSRMAANLQRHGHALVVHNRTREKADALLSGGATWADSPAALATQVEIIFTMLAPTQSVVNAALSEDGFLSKLAPGRLWVDCSTVAPTFSRSMAEEAKVRGIRFLDAPVSGSRSPAALGTLVFWVGGAAADLKACRPLLECMGSQVVHCGGTGAGTSLKIVMNQLLGTGMAAFAEALVLGESLGLSREVLLEALIGGAAAAPFLKLKRERIEKGNYEPADFPLRWLQKDLHLATTSAYHTGVAMPVTNAAKEIYRLAIRAGRGDADFSALYAYLAEQRDVHDGQQHAPGGNRPTATLDRPRSS
ncbi:MAG: 3-hydroxyisobutyrate dehydrogenase/glyoxylate/succinic semialdehyde reductase [Verrucomicrobia bacterium]|nr:3-hydroxyisobutyrate dehydrogenase/glyoxylate/succinic semialdehyde reductase [Verrucomicrobiota bacterium]